MTARPTMFRAVETPKNAGTTPRAAASAVFRKGAGGDHRSMQFRDTVHLTRRLKSVRAGSARPDGVSHLAPPETAAGLPLLPDIVMT